MPRASIDPAHLSVDYGGDRPTTRSLGDGRWIWSPLLVTLDDPGRPVVARFAILTEADARSRAVRVDVSPRDDDAEVTAASLRLPIDEIVRAAVRKAATRGPVAPPGALPEIGRPMMWRGGDDAIELPRRRRQPRDDARLREVARIYKKAPRGRVYETVAEKLDLHSENTARNLIAQARKAGHLPPYRKGRQ